MKMIEFYRKYNLNKYNFAEIAGVGTRSLIKYAEGKQIRDDTRNRIELAMRVAEKYNLVRPNINFRPGDVHGANIFRKGQREYFDRFKDLIKKESN